MSDDLLDEQRIAFGAVEDVLGHGVDVLEGQQRFEEPGRVGRPERRKGHRRRAGKPPAPARLVLEQVAPGHREDEQRALAVPGQPVEEVQHRRLRPLDVVHHHHHRATPGKRHAKNPEGVGCHFIGLDNSHLRIEGLAVGP